LDGERKLKLADTVGGYPYRLSYFDPVRHLKVGDIPYWEETNPTPVAVSPMPKKTRSH
jgi:hypothetical protein